MENHLNIVMDIQYYRNIKCFYLFCPQNNRNCLPNKKEFSYNLRLAYPITGMLGHTIVGIVDNVMVGKLGPTELAAVSLK
jgi:Na+-driven multidrug efflux pump